MSLTTDDIKKVAKLAQIHLDAHETTRLHDNLTRILTIAERMNAVDTADIEPLANPMDVHQPEREDIAEPAIPSASYQTLAPRTQSGLYIVPKVIDTE